MLVTEEFVFVHIPKTGGTFIQEVLRAHLPAVDHEAEIGEPTWSHTPYAALPDGWRERPAFCVVRNPWDWYVSWFHYQVRRGPRRRTSAQTADPWGKRALWEGPFRAGRATFKEAVTSACLGDFEHPLSPVMRSEGVDFYSARAREIVGDAFDQPNFTTLKFERGLRKQLLRFLRAHMDMPSGLVAAIRQEPRMLASDHGPYADYYDDGLRNLVGEKARWLCDRFGYRFEDGQASSGRYAAPPRRSSRRSNEPPPACSSLSRDEPSAS